MKFSIAINLVTQSASKASTAGKGKASDAWVYFLTQSAKTVPSEISKLCAVAAKSGDFTGKKGSVFCAFAPADIATQRLFLAGLGTLEEQSEKTFKTAALKAAQALVDSPAKNATVVLGNASQVKTMALALCEVSYKYGTTKSKKPDAVVLAEVVFQVPADQAAAAVAALALAQGLAQGIELARELGNLPGNICTPAYLGNVAKQLGKDAAIKVEVMERKQIEALGMGSFLSVTNGSAQPPRFIVMKYQGAGAKAAPHVLVGKGITFDTGGISLKPGAEMDEMKFDMGGAASVLGAFKAIGMLKPKLNVIGLIATCENMPSGTATKPGDVVTSMSGQTIEILNTDAEGRLVLCDALTYAERFKPASVVDIATLTGACVIALGAVNSGLFTKDDALAAALIKAGDDALDPAWRMPLQDEYDEGLKSNFADMANIAGRAGGSITAACFLQRYAKAYRWAHLDIAGTAWKSGAAKGGTGRPVALLVHYLLAQV